MEAFLIYSVVVGILFAIAFVSKRRFGILGLALAAGYLLNTALGPSLDTLINYVGAASHYFKAATLSIIIILLPAIILLFRGSKYKTIQTRVLGAVLFTILSFTILINPLSNVVTFQGIGMEIYARVIDYSDYIIAICLMIAVADVFFTKHSQPDKHRKH